MTMSQEDLTLREVAERTGTSKVTARRYLDSNRFPNAYQEDGRADGRWLVPWTDVLSSGLARKKLAASRWTERSDGDTSLDAVIERLSRTIDLQARSIDHLSALLASSAVTAPGDRHGS